MPSIHSAATAASFNKRTKTAKVSAAPHASADEPIRVVTAQPPINAPERSEVERTSREVEAIRAKLPTTPYSALDAKQRAPFFELRAAISANREAVKKARNCRTK
jgi:hypothetical protein